MAVTFVDDDPGFVSWRDAHPSGFVLSHERTPRPNFLKLHRANCPTFAGERPARGDWTRVLPKTCSDTIDELWQWADLRTGGHPNQGCTCLSGLGVPTPDRLAQVASPEDRANGKGAEARQVRVALRNELGWMLQAAARFTRGASDDMALQDSTLLHARKLVEFASSTSGRDAGIDDLAAFLDDRVLRVDAASGTTVRWPISRGGSRIASDDPERLAEVVELVLDFLEAAATDAAEVPIASACLDLVGRAREYWRTL